MREHLKYTAGLAQINMLAGSLGDDCDACGFPVKRAGQAIRNKAACRRWLSHANLNWKPGYCVPS